MAESSGGSGFGGNFFGEMFKGISQTFQAGKDVNVAQIGERQQKRNLAFNYQALAAQTESNKLSYLLQTNQQEQKTLMIAVGGIVLLLIILIIIRRLG